MRSIYQENVRNGDIFTDKVPDSHRHRKADSITSREAAENHREGLNRQAMEIWVSVQAYCLDRGLYHFTAKEIASHSGIDHVRVCRRLPELKTCGFIGKDEAGPEAWRRDGQMVWFLKECN